MFREVGSIGKFIEDREDFVDWFVIPSSVNTQTSYFIYNRYPKTPDGYQASSDYNESSFKTAVDRHKTLADELAAATSESAFDTLISNNFKQFGDIQLEVKGDGERIERFDLLNDNSYPDRHIRRQATEVNYKDPAVLPTPTAPGCTIL